MTTTMTPDDLPAILGIALSEEQLLAATAPLDPQLIVAGAGTGKTTVMAARVVWLIATGQVVPAEVLGLTFTNKAAAELRYRIRAAVSRVTDRDSADDTGEAAVSTYHAFAGQLLNQFGALLGVESDSRTLTDGQRARLAYSVACRPLDPSGFSGSPERLAERLRAMDDALADLDVSPTELRNYDTDLLQRLARSTGPRGVMSKMTAAATERLRLVDLVEQFRESKQAGELLDFSDQVRLGSQLARTSELVVERVRQQYKVVLLDEYQDTSRAQRRTLQALFGGGHAVTAVGDPCQAIYGWRGASVTNIDEFPQQFRRDDGGRASVFGLTINRRSLPAILTAANDVATDLRAFHEDVRPLRSPAGRAGGRLTCALLDSQDDELVWLGDRLAAARDQHDWPDMAVLCRSNDQVAAVVDHLRSIGVPAHVSSRRDLLALPEVVSVTSLLRIMVDPLANPQVLHHLIGPRWRIGPRDLATLGRRAKELAETDAVLPAPVSDLPISLLEAVHDPGDAPAYLYSEQARERLAEFAGELDRLDEGRDRPLPDVVAAAVDMLTPGLVAVDVADVPPTLHALVDLAQGFRAMDGSRSLPEFVSYLADCARFDTSPDDPEGSQRQGIAVMTMHAAKGLEFPLVAIPFLSHGVFPNGRGNSRWVTSPLAVPPVASDEPDPALMLGFPGVEFTGKDHDAYVAECLVDDRRDEDRLAYVAITRAETELIASGHWWGPTQKQPRGPSDYLLAVRRACEATGGQVGPWVDEAGEREDALAPHMRQIVSWPQPAARPSVVQLVDQLVEQGAVKPDADACSPRPATSDPLAGHDGIPAVPEHGERPLSPLMQTVAVLIDEESGLVEQSGDVELPGVLSASAVLSWLRAPDQFLDQLRRPMPRRPSPAAAQGVAFHSWMEHRVGQQALFELPSDDAGTAEDFAEQLARTAFADRTPHAVEQPFVIAAGGLVITGRIDAVFAVTDDPAVDWEVVDWKTGSPDRADPAQLVLYRAAWARLSGCDVGRIRATFVFLADGSHRSYDDLSRAEDLIGQQPPPGTVVGL